MYVLNTKFPFIHKLNGQTRASVNLPTATLEDWLASGYETQSAGVTINENSALKNSAYWRAVNLLSSQTASFPIGLYKRLPNGDTKEIRDHPAILLLIRKPNEIMTPFIWREAMQANVLTKGNAYSYITRSRQGTPLELRIMDPGSMVPKSNGRKLVYEYQTNETYNPYRILHVPGVSFDGVKGKSVLEAAAESIGVGLAMQKFSADFYKNGAKQTGVLMHPMGLSAETLQGLRKSFNKNMKDKDGGTMILDEGMKYQPLSTAPVDQQLLQSKQFSIQDIARWFGVPVHLLMEESRSTFNNIAEQGISFVRFTLAQWVNRWEAELNAKLLTEKEKEDHYFKFNMDSLMRGSLKERMEAYRTGLDLGIYNIDECRRLEELNELPDGLGKKHLVQVNRVPIEDLRKLEKDGNEEV